MVESTPLLEGYVAFEQKADEVVSKAMRLALLAIAFERLDDWRGKPIPRASILDEVVDHLVERMPAGLLHALFEPAPGLERKASTDAGQFDRSRSTCHARSLLD